MSGGTKRSIAAIATVAALVPLIITGWFVAPMFLPIYTWMHVDLAKISQQTGVPVERLSKHLKLKVRYEPRGEGDPAPWQIIDSSPAWSEVDPAAEDENKVLVRCIFLSGNDGQPPSTTFINNTYKDRYYRVTAQRFPPGTLGSSSKRPVILYDANTLSRMDITSADQSRMMVQGWEKDDEWPERDDGFAGAE